MAENDIPKQTDYFWKKENFGKITKTYDSKSQKERTKEAVATFNAAVKDINNSTDNYNSVNNSVNSTRAYVLKNWNEAQQTFTDNHMPYYK